MDGRRAWRRREPEHVRVLGLLVADALARPESCGGHFREESQTEENEAKRDDENYAHVAAWEYQGDHAEATRHVEPLSFNEVELTTRSYK